MRTVLTVVLCLIIVGGLIFLRMRKKQKTK
jgi:hypothetical protein